MRVPYLDDHRLRGAGARRGPGWKWPGPALGGAVIQGWQYAGYRMTIFSNEEEAPVEKDAFHGHLPFHVEDALRAAGGRVENGPKFQPFVIRDRELITGQNPASDRDLAAKLLEALDQAPAKEARAR